MGHVVDAFYWDGGVNIYSDMYIVILSISSSLESWCNILSLAVRRSYTILTCLLDIETFNVNCHFAI